MFEKILVPFDASEFSLRALEVAIDLAKKYEAELYTISIIHTPDFAFLSGEVDDVKAEGEAFFQEKLKAVEDLATAHGITVKNEIRVGHPAETILNFASGKKIDLIVLGHRGTSAIKDFLLGSVAAKVMYYAPCKVLLVR
ncbi:Nucleotide-binding universal stress protein, UspA family [Thermosyntropha lipolytica DSM 11003]|uniref:Nucleotide-binding universal stress protein, UspA family n=1 Tax=Thermosyntropha lipolytica DSM 11003 TaxID=1123382 RepID=A0A1M5NMX6_9FIRM|nr:universal stress protein [Thermosyntropha lipolytica]SHG90872.1 Nucleotide-binding universal stress protein, UspA family [Thermosyntropha lipolytica DSM 11003]